MENIIVEVVSENEFTKVFKVNGTELYISKAYDDDSNYHFLVANIPKIESLNIERISYPMPFEKEEQRNAAFEEINSQFAADFITKLINQIVENKKNEEK